MAEPEKTRKWISIVQAAEHASMPLHEIRDLHRAGVLEGGRSETGVRRVYIDSLTAYLLNKNTANNQVENQPAEEVTINEVVRMAGLTRSIIIDWVDRREVVSRVDHEGRLLIDFNSVKRKMKNMG